MSDNQFANKAPDDVTSPVLISDEAVDWAIAQVAKGRMVGRGLDPEQAAISEVLTSEEINDLKRQLPDRLDEDLTEVLEDLIRNPGGSSTGFVLGPYLDDESAA